MVDSAVLGVCVWHARDALLLKTDAPRQAGLSPESSVLFLSSQSRVDRRRRAAPLHSVSVASDQRADRDSASYPHIDAGFLQNAHFGWLLGCFGAATRRASRIFYITTKAQRHLFYALSAPQILFRASRPRRLPGVASSVAFPLFGWVCSSYRRTWGCVKCGAASAASWRSRVAARHCYYGPPVSICCEF